MGGCQDICFSPVSLELSRNTLRLSGIIPFGQFVLFLFWSRNGQFGQVSVILMSVLEVHLV